MAGLIDIAPGGSQAVEAQGTYGVPSNAGEVLGEAAAGGFAHAFPAYETSRAETEQGIPLDAGEAMGRAIAGTPTTGFAPAPGILSPEEANARYGIKDRLSWTAPVPDSVAAEQNRRQRDAIAREDVIARREGGFLTGGVARFGAGLAGGLPGLIDPLNLAASFMPLVPTARAALWAARFGDVGGGALTGAVTGAAGQAALTPYQYLLSKNEGEDYGAVDAILNIALGAVFGGGLHVAGSLFGRRGADLSLALDREQPETREALLRGAIADLADDRPVSAPGALAERVRAEGEAQAQRMRDTDAALLARRPAGLDPYERTPREPMRLASYLQREGGVQNEGGEIGEILDWLQSRPGLVNKNGMSLDTATHLAWEAGYLRSDAETIGNGQPTQNVLLDALESDLKGHPVYSEHDLHAVAAFNEALDRNHEIDRLAQEHGIDVRGLSREQFFDQVAQKLGAVAARAESERAALWVGEHEDDLPGFDEPARATDQELEDGYRQATGDLRADAGRGGLAEFAGERGTAASGEADHGPGGFGPGARRRGAAREPDELAAGELEAEARDPQQALTEEIAALDRDIAQAQDAGELGETPRELTEADEAAQQAEAIARATEQGGLCLGRRM
jgi:hypothetical protein